MAEITSEYNQFTNAAKHSISLPWPEVSTYEKWNDKTFSDHH
jgi:hypothetical protein